MIAPQVAEEARLIRDRRSAQSGGGISWRRAFCGPAAAITAPSGPAAAAAAQAQRRAPSSQGLEEGSGQVNRESVWAVGWGRGRGEVATALGQEEESAE